MFYHDETSLVLYKNTTKIIIILLSVLQMPSLIQISPNTCRNTQFKNTVSFYPRPVLGIGIACATLLAKKVVTPPLKTIKPMWIKLLCFHLAEIGMIWTRDCSPTKSDTTLGRHSMQGQVGSSSSETTV